MFVSLLYRYFTRRVLLTRQDLLTLPDDLKSLKGEKKLTQSFNFSFRYIDDVLSLNNNRFTDYLHIIYPSELEIKDNTNTDNSASYLDLFLEIDKDGKLQSKIYDKRDDFDFQVVNFPFLCNNIPASPAYGVYVIRYATACSNYTDFVDRGIILSRKLPLQGYESIKLKSTLKKFYGRHHELVDRYNVSVSTIMSDLLPVS